MGVTLGSLAELQLLRGDLDAADTALAEALSLSKALTNAELAGVSLNLQGFLWLARGDPGRATEVFRASLRHSYPRGFTPLIGESLLGLASAAAQQGTAALALRLSVAGRQVLATAGQLPSALLQAAIDRTGQHVDQALDQPAQQAIRAAARAATLDQVVAEATAGPE